MTANPPVRILEPVALLADEPDHGLARGQVGTVVELLDQATVEVEFSDDKGVCYALLPLPFASLLPLRFAPQEAA